LDEALSLLTRAAQVQDSTIVRYNLGRAFLTRGKGVDAVNHLKEVVQREPERGPALAALSQAYLAMGDMGRAKETAERAIRQDRTLASAELAMGRYLFSAGDLKAAGRTFDRALKLGEAETSRRRSREASLRGGPRPSPARADYTRAWAWRNNPELAQVHLARAGLFLVTSEREGKPSFFRWLWRVLVKEPSPMALHPNWLAALRVQAGLLISQGALDQAAETLKKLEDQDPKDVQTYMDLAQLRRRQWKMLHDAQKEEESQKKLELARAEYRLLVERGVAPAQGYYGLGEIARDIQDWATALAEYQRAVQVDSGYAEAWLRMGQVNVVLGDEGPALEHFARAIETAGWRGGVRVDAHTERGTIFLEQYLRGKDQVPPPQQRLGDARNEFQAAVQVYANATGALAGLGRVAFEEGDYGTAERFFQQAVQLNKWDFGGLYGLGRIYEAREQSATAMKYLERAVGVYYNSITAHYHLGAAYYAQLNESKARAEFEWVKSHCPDLAGQGRLKYDDRESCLEVEGWLKRLSSGSS
jgi:tetratricopeptide (TPR) repeat protein